MQQKVIEISTYGRGLYPITDQVTKDLTLPKTGIVNIFVQHTSTSLLIQENYDPTAKADLEEFFCRLVPDKDKWYTHILEGPDDGTSHLKSALTATSLNVPITNGKIGLGQWQGIYLFEHRLKPHLRKVIVTVN